MKQKSLKSLTFSQNRNSGRLEKFFIVTQKQKSLKYFYISRAAWDTYYKYLINSSYFMQ